MAGSKGAKTGGSTSLKTGGGSTSTKVSTPKGSGSSSAGSTASKEVMKAPGQDGFIIRKDFEDDPKSYFKGLRD